MKKTLLALTLVITGLTSFGQGYFLFSGSSKGIWDDTTGTPKLDSGLDVAFLYAPLGTAATLTNLAASTATNGSTQVNYTSAWSDILTNSGGFTLAFNAANSTLAVTNTSNNGGFTFSYNGTATFGVEDGANNVTAGGSTYEIYVIAWSSAYSTPYAAAAAGASVGWSSVFNYATSSSLSSPPGSFATAGETPFGVGPVPEPSTIALAGMGIASLLAFRRRK